MTQSGHAISLIGLRSQLDCETRKLDTCLWNLAWYWRRKSAVRSVLSHTIPTCKPPLSSVATDKEAFDEHQDRVAGTCSRRGLLDKRRPWAEADDVSRASR